MTRHRQPSARCAPPLVTLVVAGLLVGSWTAWRAGTPRADRLPDPAESAFAWAGPGVGPMVVTATDGPAATLVLGDSRGGAGISTARVEAACPGAGATALAWYHGAALEDLIEFASHQDARSDIVLLSPLGLLGFRNPLVAEMLREAPDGGLPVPLRTEFTAKEFEAWSATERAHLVALGFREPSVDYVISSLFERTNKARNESPTARIDRTLAGAVGEWRRRHLRPIEPALWRERWLRVQDPVGSLAEYRAHLAPRLRDAREAAATSITRDLADLVAAGHRVVCVRLPVSPEQRALEDERVPPERLARIAREASVPYLDLGGWPDATSDGSHLTWDAAERASRAIGAWLREDLGW